MSKRQSFYSNQASDGSQSDGESSSPTKVAAPTTPIKRRKRRDLWDIYLSKTRESDLAIVHNAKNTSDTYLLFAAFLSIIITIFISHSYPLLQTRIFPKAKPIDPRVPPKPIVATPLPYAIRVNAFLFSALFLGVTLAITSIFIQRLSRAYTAVTDSKSSSRARARIRYGWQCTIGNSYLAEMVVLEGFMAPIIVGLFTAAVVDMVLSTAPWIVALGPMVILAISLIALLVFRPSFVSSSSPQLPNRLWNNSTSKKKSSKSKGIPDEEPTFSPSYNGPPSDTLSDIAILGFLLQNFDKEKEKAQIEQCLIELRRLPPLTKSESEMLLNQLVIVDVLGTIASHYLVKKRDGEAIEESHLERARDLCDFVAWYLYLPRSSTTKARLRRAVPPMLYKLANALSKHRSSSHTLISALSALGALDHLFDTDADSANCGVCKSIMRSLADNLEYNDAMDGEAKAFCVSSALVRRTGCLMRWDGSGGINVDGLRRDVNVFERGFDRYSSKEVQELWEAVLRDKKKSPELDDAYFRPLLSSLRKDDPLAQEALMGLRNKSVRIRVPSIPAPPTSMVHLPGSDDEDDEEVMRRKRESFISEDGSEPARYVSPGSDAAPPRWHWR